MKKYELLLNVRNEDANGNFQPKSFDRIEADTMVELLAQLQIAIATVMEKELDELRLKLRFPSTVTDDDIPF